MSAVAEVLGTIIEETGRATAGSHSLNRAASRTDGLQKALQCAFMFTSKLSPHFTITVMIKCMNSNKTF